MKQALRYIWLLGLIVCAAASAADGGDVDKLVGRWHLKCASDECELSIKHPSGSPALYASFHGKDASLASYAFIIEADIDTQQPLAFQFSNIVADKSKPGCAQATDVDKSPDCFKLNGQKEDAFTGPFTACQSGFCISKLIGDADSQGEIPPRLQHFAFVVLAFKNPKGVFQTQVLDIRGFSAAYDEAVKQLALKH
jgi:hypothetical protein